MTGDLLRLGLGVTAAPDVVQAARRAEDLGFGYVSCGEHLFFHGAVPNAFVALAAAAAVTDRIELLSSITILPLYPAAMAAKLAAMVDVVSAGRFNLGVGAGGEFAREFDAVGVPVAQRGARTDEGLEVLRLLFTGEEVHFQGTWSSLDALALNPPPCRRGGPPLWIAGRGDVATRRAARWGDVWMPHLCTPGQLARGMSLVRERTEEFGRRPDDVTGAVFAFVTTYPDGDAARRTAIDWVGNNYKQDFSELGHLLVAGTPTECADRLREYQAAGAASVQLTIAAPQEDADVMLDRIAHEILPQFAPSP
ncbi:MULTISPECIES: LLM class flavin-dependent oxidoreductase [unclassified Nocardioides]|uniref:LLM class flavin-dependent oxidoreductase n=1 Tax=unclassified Nocardioides TaxID=2615069 RepID=UPI000057057D|nr:MULTISPECIES: LLM class flavin-dependent oxidoreductase [unclassified Nocardioides]ABL80335.1 luciferase family protein [Nocardioides sp. JS614]